jgi:uncharacterized repeat protein (TIGR02543 family)
VGAPSSVCKKKLILNRLKRYTFGMTFFSKVALVASLSLLGVATTVMGVALPAQATGVCTGAASPVVGLISYTVATDCTANVVTGPNASFSIPDSIEYSGETYVVTSISDYAFDGKTGILSVGLPAALESIGAYAFRDTSLMGNLNLTSLTSLTSIGAFAFQTTDYITGLQLPASLTTLGEGAFKDTLGMTGTLDLSALTSLTSIPDYAFYCASGLTSLILPSSVTSIGLGAFAGVALAGTLDLSSATSLTTIAEDAFFNDAFITGVVFPPSLTSIGKHAFYNDGLLAGNLDFSALTSLDSIGAGAFELTAVTGATFPASLTSIGATAFAGTEITQVTFTDNLPEVGSADSFPLGTTIDFAYCEASLTWFSFEAVPGVCSITFETGLGTPISSQTVAFGATFVTPDAPTREGFIFSGWATTLDGDVPVAFPITASENVIAYARWIAVEKPTPPTDAVPAELSLTGLNAQSLVSLAALLLMMGVGATILTARRKRR